MGSFMDEEELATPSRSATPSHVDTATHKKKRERTAEQKKQHNQKQRVNRGKRLKTAETVVPALSANVKVAEEQNTALNAALQEKELRIAVLEQHLEDKKKECAAAQKAQQEAEQAFRDAASALSFSEALSFALKGELATASGTISSLDSEAAQLRIDLAIATAPAASAAVLCSEALGVASALSSLAGEVIQSQLADDTSASVSSLSLRADSPPSFDRTPPRDVSTFTPSPPPGFLDP